MTVRSAADVTSARDHLREHGYAVIPSLLDRARTGLIAQYGRAWVKPFVDLRSPLTAEFAARLSPRLRYMMGCNANAPVRG